MFSFHRAPEPGNIEEIADYANSVCDASQYPPDTIQMAVNFAEREANIHLPDEEGYSVRDRTVYLGVALYNMASKLID